MPRTIFYLLLMTALILSCQKLQQTEENKGIESTKRDYIRSIPGDNDTIPLAVIKKGEVLIAYSGCYDCHTREKRSKGPAFRDIAARYPVKKQYIELLANKVISGGTGSWGNPVMAPHPNIPLEDAKTMAKYILSLKE